MPTTVQFRRGTTAQNDNFTGAVGEISIDTTLDQIRLHDGSTAGGIIIGNSDDKMQVANTNTLVNDRMQVANTIAISNARLGATATVALTGDITASATAFSGNTVSLTTTIANDSVDGNKLTDNITLAGDFSVNGVSANTIFIKNADNYHVHTVTVSSKSSAHPYTGSGSASAYFLDGVESPSLVLAPNQTYRLNQEDSSNSSHPLKFYTDAARSNEYTTGVTVNGSAGSSGAYTEIVVNENTPQVLYYQCQNHAYMGSVASVLSDTSPKYSEVANTQALFNTVSANNMSVANTRALFSTVSANNMSVANTRALFNTVNANNMSVANTRALVNDRLGATASVTLTGDVTGSGSFSSNAVSITTVVADDSHNHIIGNVDGLQDALDNRMTVANTQALADARLGATATVQITGAVAGGATAFSSNSVSIAVTQQNDSVTLGTHTTGNYVGTITGGTGIASSGSTSGEGVAHTLSVDLSELTDMTQTMVGSDEFIVLDAGADRRKAASEIGLSIFNNDAGFSTTTGTVTSHTVGAGDGLTGGGTVTSSGTTTVNVGAGTLIDVTADAVNVDLSELTTSTSDGDGDFFAVIDSSNNQKKLTKGNINISGFNNDANFSTTTGTVTSVNLTAGNLIDVSGGPVTSSGSITVNVDLSELTDMTAAATSSDEMVLLDSGAQRRKRFAEIPLSVFDRTNQIALATHTTGNYVSGISGTANEISVSGSGSENATVTIGLPDDVTVAGQLNVGENVVISGNLIVSGTQTTVNSNNVEIGDAIITLNSDLSSGTPASENAGILINRGSDADVSFVYDETSNRWTTGSQQLVTGDHIPNTDSAEDLGTTSVRWRKLFADDGDFGGDVSVAGDITVTGTINATVTGTSDSATTLATPRTIALGNDLSGSADFDGSEDITINATIQNNSVALGTQTTGNYVGTITGGTGIASSGATSGEGIAHTLSLETVGAGSGTYGSTSNGTKIDTITVDDFGRVTAVATGATGDILGVTAGTGLSGGGSSGTVTLNVDLSELTDMTATMVGTDEFIVLDAGADRRKAASEIGLSIFNNDAGFSTTTGTVTSHTVGAGSGLTGGGTVTSSGTTTLNVGAGTGISVSADAVALATAGVGAGTYGSTGDGTKIDEITVDAYGRITNITTGATGDIQGVTAGTGLSGGGNSGSVSLAVDLSELTDMTATMVGTDEFIVLDAGADRRKAASEIGLSIFNNDANFSTTTGTVTSVATGTGLTGGTITSSGTISLATAGAGAGTYGSTDDGTKIDQITLDAYGRVTAVSTGATMDRFIVEDGDGTEVAITRDKEWKFVEAGGININWTDTSTGSDGDPYDLSFSINTGVTAGSGLTGGGTLSSTRTLNVGEGTGISVAADSISVDYGTTSGTACQGNDARLSDSRTCDNTFDNASTARSNLGLGSLATLSSVNAATITDNSVGAAELNVSGNGSAGQYLESDGDGSFTWSTVSGYSDSDVDAYLTAGSGIDYSSGTISIESDLRGNAWLIGRDTNDYYNIGTSTHDWYINGGHEMRLESDGDLHVEGDIVAHSTTVSDERLKENIQPIENALDKIKQLNGYSFNYKKDGKESVGLIAQEVEKVIPSAVQEKKLINEDDQQYKILEYTQLIGVLVEAIKDQQEQIDELKAKIK